MDDSGVGAPPSQTEGGSVDVLLVDDERALAEVTAEHLQRQHAAVSVTVTTSGRDALDTLDERSIDCLVSDYEMPGMDGLDLLRAVQKRHPSLPFILYTAHGSEEIASEAISAGVTDYLQKRTASDQYAVLANRIENAVARSRSERARKESELRYRNLVEASPHAILVHRDGAVVYANETMATLSGYDGVEALYGTDPLDLVAPEDRTLIDERMTDVIEGGDADWTTWGLQRADDTVRRVESRGSRVDYDGRPAVQVVIRDVADRHGHARLLDALDDATRALLTADSARAVAQTAVAALADVLDDPEVTVFRASGGGLEPLATTDPADGPAWHDTPDRLTDTDETTAFREGDPRLVEGYSGRTEDSTGPVGTVLMLPLGEYGLLRVASTEPDAFDDTDRTVLELLARSMRTALDRLDGV